MMHITAGIHWLLFNILRAPLVAHGRILLAVDLTHHVRQEMMVDTKKQTPHVADFDA
jgi:hypothetical protein